MRRMLMIYLSAAAMLVLALMILVRDMGPQWRGALLTGIMALWLWGMAVSLSHFVDFCRLFGSQGTDAPSSASQMITDCLVTCASVNTVTLPLMVLCAIAFFVQRNNKPKTASISASL